MPNCTGCSFTGQGCGRRGGRDQVNEAQVVAELQRLMAEAVAERRGLVAFSRLGASDLDRMARRAEQEALERVGALLPTSPTEPVLREVSGLLASLQAALRDLEDQQGIREDSRLLARDELVWETFERVAALLRVL
jgi:hypothetical protein